MARKKAEQVAPSDTTTGGSGLAITWSEQVVSVSKLKPYERNPRRISEKAFVKLKESLQISGYHQRIVVTHDLAVVGGHQRIQALKQLGIHEVPVLVPDRQLSEEEFRRILIQDNLPFGEFDFDILANDFSIEELLDYGMPDKWLDEFPEEEESGGLTDPDETPDLQEQAITVPGDVWVLGHHRIICGDSTQADVVEKLLAGVKPHLMVTDPPYSVEYDASWRDKSLGGKAGGRATGKVKNDNNADWSAAWALFPGHIAYVWHGMLRSSTVFESLTANDFKVRAEIIWAKSHFAISRGDYHAQHESCWYAVKGTGNWTGNRSQTTLWQIDKPQKSETGHSTQKPVECMKRPMENNSSVGQAIYEPFSGSGTTIIAGQQCGRHIYAIELSEQYVDMAVRRWQNFTGLEAVHAETGETFNAVESRARGKAA